MIRFADVPDCVEWKDFVLFSTLFGRRWRGIDIWIEAFPLIPINLGGKWTCLFFVRIAQVSRVAEKHSWKDALLYILWPWQILDMRQGSYRPPAGARQDLCQNCGACCNPVEAPTPEWIVSEMEKRGSRIFPLEDVKFILEVLRQISPEEGYRRNPYLREKHVSFGDSTKFDGDTFGEPEKKNYRFYECPYYDGEHRRCTVHGTSLKPPVCRDYPLYGKKGLMHNRLLATPECGYHALQ